MSSFELTQGETRTTDYKFQSIGGNEMTNEEKATEEKANELANKCPYYDRRDQHVTTRAILEMAEWKDKRFKMFLECFQIELFAEFNNSSGKGYLLDIISKIDELENEILGEETK